MTERVGHQGVSLVWTLRRQVLGGQPHLEPTLSTLSDFWIFSKDVILHGLTACSQVVLIGMNFNQGFNTPVKCMVI